MLPLINKSYGPNHLYTARVLGSIARLYTLQERYSEAELLVNRAMVIQKKVYGPEHHLIAPTQLIMARICIHQGRYSEAQKLCNRALSSLENVFDRNHPNMRDAIDTMTQLYHKTGNVTDAAKIGQRAERLSSPKQAAYDYTSAFNSLAKNLLTTESKHSGKLKDNDEVSLLIDLAQP